MLEDKRMVPFAPAEPFRFCPADGARLGAVGAVIVEDGRALVTVQVREPEKGRLDLPGGSLGVGEHPVDGLARE